MGLIVLAGCVGRNLPDNSVPEPTTNTEEMTKIFVHSFYCYDLTNAEIRPAYYIFEGDSLVENAWQCAPITIEGFDYEPGYQYQLAVEQIVLEGLPAYRLSKIISKERDPAYFKIYDSWALTHLNKEVLPIAERRPTAEINLTDFTIAGNGMCNNYSGKLNYHSIETIAFGPLMSTKMMCPEIGKEQAFMGALGNVQYYEITGLNLFFYDNSHQEILRFQKVD